MTKLARLAPWLPNYLKAFGAVSGLAVFIRMVRLTLGGSAEPHAVRVPGLDRPVWVRAGLNDISIFQQVFVKGEYDIRGMPQFPRLQAAYQAEVAAGRHPLIVDCGAHIGLSVRWFRRMFPAAHIVAVEPSAANQAVLRRNLDGIEGVTILHGGVWDTPGTLHFEDPNAGMTAFRLASGAGGGGSGQASVPALTIPAFTIPGIMAEMGADTCLLVKVDIEGGESELFRSHAEWLHRAGLVIVELHDWLLPWQGTSRTLFQRVVEGRFDTIMRGENIYLFRDTGAPASA